MEVEDRQEMVQLCTLLSELNPAGTSTRTSTNTEVFFHQSSSCYSTVYERRMSDERLPLCRHYVVENDSFSDFYTIIIIRMGML